MLCDFERDVDAVRILPIAAPTAPGPGKGPNLNWIGGVAQRYDGLGLDRLRLRWAPDAFWTTYVYDVPLFDGPTVPPNSSVTNVVPRVDHLDPNVRLPLREAVQRWVRASTSAPKLEGSTANWQGIADQVVLRFADPLR